jgi:hypothetical protein
MFFLLRMAFWLGLALVLLPTDNSSDTDKTKPHDKSAAVETQIDPMAAATAAAAAMSDMSQFCTRQPAACEAGAKAATVIGERAQNGARKVYQFINEKKNDTKKDDAKDRDDPRKDHTGSIGGSAHTHVWHGTLSQTDLAIAWQTPLPAPDFASLN